MTGRAFRIASIVSFVLCLAVLGLWVRSYWRMDQYNRLRRTGQQIAYDDVCSACGDILIGRLWIDDEIVRGADIRPGFSSTPLMATTSLVGWVETLRAVAPANAPPWSFRFAGFDAYVERGKRGTDWMIVIPLWFPAAVTAILPLLFLHRLRKARRRRAQGLCRRCGYDLRASTERCPECGTPVPPRRSSE